MSVILYEDEKFQRIRQSLRKIARDHLASFFMPRPAFEGEGWTYDFLWGAVDNFVQDIADMNTAAFNARYKGEDVPRRDIRFFAIPGYASDVELIKSLQGVRYNSYEAENVELMGRLEDLLFRLMSVYISQTPAYEAAQTW